ncbi:MAG: helix-turn-helix transcriptional regulator [Victivallales bacterium]
MTPKYNWPVLVKEIQDTLFMSQEQMATKLKVSQQSISNWMNGTRNPSEVAMPKILKMAQDGGMDISKYEANAAFDRITGYMKKNKSRELVRLFDLYGRMNRADRQKLIKYAEKI